VAPKHNSSPSSCCRRAEADRRYQATMYNLDGARVEAAWKPMSHVGARVEALWSLDGLWYGATVEKINADGSYSIKWDDGDAREKVKVAAQIRVQGKPEDKHYDDNHADDGSGVAKRGCTDVLCLLVFIAFLGAMGHVTHYAVKNGNPKRLTHGFDFGGKLCGVDAGVEASPFLYYCPNSVVGSIPLGLNLKAPVCVSKCPTGDSETVTCLSQTAPAVQPATSVNPNQTVVLTQGVVQMQTYATKPILGLYCIPDLVKLNAIAQASGVATPVGLRDSMFSSSGPVGNYMAKAQQAVGSLQRCKSLLAGTLGFAFILGYVYLFLLKRCARPLIYGVLLIIVLGCWALAGFFIIGEAMPRPGPISGFTTVSPAAVNSGTAAPVAVTTAVPVNTFHAGATVAPTTAAPVVVAVATDAPTVAPAAPTPAVAVAATVKPAVVVAAVTVASTVPLPPGGARRIAAVPTSRRLLTYQEACVRIEAAGGSCNEVAARWEKFDGRKKWEEANPFYSEHLSLENAKKATTFTACFFAVLGLIFLIAVCCAHNAINVACGCVGAATDALFSMPCMLLMPVIESLIKVVTFSVLMYFFAFLISAGEMDTKTYTTVGGEDVNGLRRHFKHDDKEKGFIWFYIFGIFWFMELANAMGQFAISWSVVGWYYTPKPKNHNVAGLLWGYIYGCTFHLGTLAFGSFIIALCRWLRLVMTVLERTEGEGNPVAKCIAKILICCITCFEKFFKMINKNAYIDVCITSNNFCGAAGDVMQFLVGNAPEIVILNGACMVFCAGGVTLISGLTGFLTYTLVTGQERWTDEASPHHVDSPFFVAGVATIGAVFVSYSFMVIFDHTADTLLYTFCWNKSKAHNTVGKYAPDSLAALVNYAPLKKAAAAEPAKKEENNGGFFSTWFSSKKADNGSSTEREPLVAH